MKEIIALVWRPKCGFEITIMRIGVFLFWFFHYLDVQRIRKGEPWSFGKHLLILGIIKEGVNRATIPLFSIPFWIQIHTIPLVFMSQEVGLSIGNYTGKFLEYDVKNNSNLLCSFMCIRVLLDVRKPLNKSKKVKKKVGDSIEVLFK